MTISLNLFDPVPAGNGALGDYTLPFKRSWRRSIARRGGFKIGTVELTTQDMTPGEMGEFFRFGLMREIRETGSGQQTWQGAVSKMQWTHQGDVFLIDLANMYNARRALYRRLFDNLLTNGSAESGAWAVYNGATVTQSIEWVADGTYSCKIVVADSVVRGAWLQTDIPITAGIKYDFTVRLHVVEGAFRITISYPGTTLGSYDTGGALGDIVAAITISKSNTYTGNVNILIVSVHSAGPATGYFDAAVFKIADQPADTGWQVDVKSGKLFGRREWIDLWGGMSYQAANARVASDLILSAWPQSDIPPNGATRQIAVDPHEDKLSIVFAGYYATLNWIYTRLAGSGAASSLVATLAGYQTDFIQLGHITTNTLSCTIEDSNPVRCGDALKEICDSSDASGGLWSLGAYANRQLEYQPVAAELSYHLQGGHLLSVGGGDMEPWLARPGWAQVDDLPLGPSPLSGAAQNNARWRYLEEIEMMPPDNDHAGYWLSYNRESIE